MICIKVFAPGLPTRASRGTSRLRMIQEGGGSGEYDLGVGLKVDLYTLRLRPESLRAGRPRCTGYHELYDANRMTR